MLDRRNIIFLGSLISQLGLFAVYVGQPQYLWPLFAAATLLLLVTIYLITSQTTFRAFIPAFAIFPLIAHIALYLASTLPADRTLVFVLAVVIDGLIAIYLRMVYIFVATNAGYRIGSLEHFSAYACLIVSFLLSLSFFGFKAFLDVPDWLSLPLFMLGLLLILYHFFWSNKFEWSEMKWSLILAVLMVLEATYAISRLPFDYFTASVLLVVLIYALINTLRLEMLGRLVQAKIRYYFAFVVISYIIIYLSAQWL